MGEQASPNWPQVIESLRSCGLSQQQIAALCSVTQQQISSLARGETKEPGYRLGSRLLRIAAEVQNPFRVRVLVNAAGEAVNVTRVDADGRVRSVIWQRPVSLEDGPFTPFFEIPHVQDLQARLAELHRSVTALLARSREASAQAAALHEAFHPAGGGRRR